MPLNPQNPADKLAPDEEASLGDPSTPQPGDPTEIMLRVNGAELQIIYSALDEGPGKFTRVLYGKIQKQVDQWVLATRRARLLSATNEAAVKAAEKALRAAAAIPAAPLPAPASPVDTAVGTALTDAAPTGTPG